MKDGMSIGQLAKEAGLGIETIRYYERERLIPAPRRTQSNYRLYDADALGRLRFIRNAKELGFTLEEISRLLRMSENAHADAGDFHALATEKIEWIEERIKQFKSMRDILVKAVKACPGHGADKSECPVLGLLIGEDCPHSGLCHCNDDKHR